MKKDRIPWYQFLLCTGNITGEDCLFVWCRGDFAHDTDKKAEAVFHEIKVDLSMGKSRSRASKGIIMGFREVTEADPEVLLSFARTLNELAKEHGTKVIWKFAYAEVQAILEQHGDEFTIEESFSGLMTLEPTTDKQEPMFAGSSLIGGKD